MADTTIIGSGTFVRGRVTGTGDLEIAGRIEGEVACAGEVVVEGTGLVGAGISARRIVVRGAVKGDLVAEEAILLEAGARVIGDLRAPRIAIAPGGLVRGHVQTGAAGAARPRSASASASRPSSSDHRASATRALAPAKVAPATAKAAPARSEPKKAPPVTARNTNTNAKPTPHRGGSLVAGRLGPPPPVVPVLKKGTKAVAHHKKR